MASNLIWGHTFLTLLDQQNPKPTNYNSIFQVPNVCFRSCKSV